MIISTSLPTAKDFEASSRRRSTAAFPALLLAVPVARLGDVEPIAVYLLATELGELNTKAIAKREGFGEALGSKAGSAGDVADYEATNTETAISMEVSKIVVPYVLLSIFTLIGLPFIIFVAAIWAFASGVSSGTIDSELAGRFLLLATAGVAATSYIDSNSFNNDDNDNNSTGI